MKEKYKAGGLPALINSVPESVSKGIGNFSMVIFSGYITASLCSAGALMLLVDYSLKPTRGMSAKNKAINANLPQITSPNYFAIRKGVVNRNLFNSEGEVPDEKEASKQEKPESKK